MGMMSKTTKGVFHVLGKRQKTKHPALPIAKLKAPDARRVLPKGLPCLYFNTWQGILHEKFFQNYQNLISGKKEVNKMAFFATAITGVNCE